MDPHLMDSQFAALEEPDDVVVVDVSPRVAEIVTQIQRELGLERPRLTGPTA
jgi:gluconate kinase